MPHPTRLPSIRRPTLLHGNLTYRNLSIFAGRWTVICVLKQVRPLDVLFLNQQEVKFAEEQVTLAALVSGPEPFHQPWVRGIPSLTIPLIADPLGNVCRRFGISRSWKNRKIHSLIFDACGTMHAHLIHELNGRGMAFVMEMVVHGRNSSQSSLRHAFGFLSPASSHTPASAAQEDQQYVRPYQAPSQ